MTNEPTPAAEEPLSEHDLATLDNYMWSDDVLVPTAAREIRSLRREVERLRAIERAARDYCQAWDDDVNGTGHEGLDGIGIDHALDVKMEALSALLASKPEGEKCGGFSLAADGGFPPCPICGRRSCDHSLEERGGK